MYLSLPDISGASGELSPGIRSHLTGMPTTLPWGIYLDGAVRHPIPLYESFLGLLLCGLAVFLLRRGLPAGVTGLSLGITYLVVRSALDTLRASGMDGPNVLVLGGFTLTQALTLFLVPVLAILLWWMARKPLRPTGRVQDSTIS